MHYIVISLCLLLSLLAGCSKPGLPAVDPGNSLEEETRRINSKSEAESVTGTYRVIMLFPYNNDLMGTVEGHYTYGEPDPTFMKSNYTLTVKTNATNDSLLISLSGTGSAGSFSDFTFPASGLTYNSGLEKNAAGYLYTMYHFGTRTVPRTITVIRRAFSDKTQLLVGIHLGKYRQSNGQLTGDPLYYPEGQYPGGPVSHFYDMEATRQTKATLSIVN